MILRGGARRRARTWERTRGGSIFTGPCGWPRGFSTDIPARLERLPWGRFHTLVVVALGITWILDGLEVTLAGSVAGALKQSPTLALRRRRRRLRRQRLSRRRCRRARCSSAGSPTGSAARSCSSSPSRVYLVATALTGLSWNGCELLPLPLPHRRRHRRRIRRDQLHHPGTCSRRAFAASPISCINGSFWVGAALGALGARRAADPRRLRSRHRLARSPFSSARRSALVVFLMRHVDARKPALAASSTGARGGARRSSTASRSVSRRGRRRSRRSKPPRSGCARAATPRSARSFATLFRALSRAAPFLGPDADGGAGLLLQRDLLHLRAGADEVLRGPLGPRRLVHPAFRHRQFSRARCCSAASSTRSAAGAMIALDLCAVRAAARRLRRALRSRPPDGV